MNRRGFLGTLAALVGTLSLKAKEPKPRLVQHAEARAAEFERCAFVETTGSPPEYMRLYISDDIFEEHIYSDSFANIKIESLGDAHKLERSFHLTSWSFEIEPVRLREEGAIGFRNCHVRKVWQRDCSCGPVYSV